MPIEAPMLSAFMKSALMGMRMLLVKMKSSTKTDSVIHSIAQPPVPTSAD